MVKIEKLLVPPFEIEVHYKRIENIYLRVKPDGKLMISAPFGISQDYLTKFINSRNSWILAKQQKMFERQEAAIKLEEDEMLLFGKPFKGNLSETELQKLLHEKITRYHEKYWHFFKAQGCSPIEIKYRMMKRTWGICRPTARMITFNKRLVHQPDTFIEYVVLHELCHLLIPNHSKDFYELVASHMPHFRQYEKNGSLYFRE